MLMSACSVVQRDGIYQSKRYKQNSTKIWKIKKNSRETTTNKSIVAARTLSSNIEKPAKTPSNNAETTIVTPKKTVTAINKDSRRLLRAIGHMEDGGSIHYVNNWTSLQNTYSDSCDMLVLRNGDEIEAKVTEISTSEIKYKRCNHLTGPTVIIDKADVLFVKYSNGTKEVFNTKQAPQRVERPTTSNDSGSPALRAVGVILIIIGVLFILAVSILGGLIVLGLGLLFLSSGKK